MAHMCQNMSLYTRTYPLEVVLCWQEYNKCYLKSPGASKYIWRQHSRGRGITFILVTFKIKLNYGNTRNLARSVVMAASRLQVLAYDV
jgi:hypothetical protein